MTTTQLNDLFDQMENEEGNQLDDKIKFEENKYAQEIYNDFLNYLDLGGHYMPQSYKLPEDLVASAKNITAFTMKLKESSLYKKNIQSHITAYINKLIEFSTDKKHLLIFPETKNKNFEGIGRCLENKEIQIYGDCGLYLGAYMQSGKIIANGPVNHFPGYHMRGGELVINESYGKTIGLRMIGGEILVKNLKEKDKIKQNNYEKLEDGYTRITPKIK